MSSSVLAYSMGSSGEVFLTSREVALQSLDGRTYDLQQATKDVFAAVLQGESQLPAPLRERITRHALALAMTSPEVFGPSFKLNTLARRGQFSLTPIAELEHAHERYDIVQWIACYKLLGKAFDLEGWEPFWARSLVAGAAPKDVVVQVSLGNQESMDVTKEAKEAMDQAIIMLQSKPAPLYHAQQAGKAAALILDKDEFEYIMPQSDEDLEAFDWDKVEKGELYTYPVGPPPPQVDFAKVRAVFNLSKLERDEIARAMGLPHSGGPCYESFLTKWKLWRDLHALFRTMYPNEDKSTSNARVMGSMKYCNSVAAIGNKVDEEITKFLGARNRAKQKVQLAEQLAVREAEEKAAAEKAKQLEAQKVQKEKEREQVANQRTTVATMGRVTRTRNPMPYV